jgi:type 2 lantibiotic biosynthesis protein LanM
MNDAKYLEAADRLGARLCRDAIWSGERCNWLGDSMEFIESRWQVAHRAFGPELYNGTSGIALFLACLFSFTQEKIFRKTAQGAINCALSQLDRIDPATGFGFYSGLTGIAYALVEAGEIFGEEPLVQRGLELLEKVHSPEPSSEQSWDVVSGSAGVIPVLLKLNARYGKPFLRDAALKHGEQILPQADHGEEGWSWKTIPDPAMKNLTGFSHGTAGIAWALLELHHQLQTHDERFLQAAQQALRYERRWFDPQQENWPDFRSQDQAGGPVYAAAWCHGAPGIGLSRLRCYQLLQDRECLAEAQAALRTTSKFLSMAASAGQGNYCLCHGNCGNAELLIAAGDLLQDSESLKTVHQMADSALEKYHLGGNPWPCGVLNGGETPNLMLGLAGIGYFFLRLYDRRAPSVLLVGPR